MSKHLRSRMVGCLLTMAVAAIAFAPAANAAQTDPVIQAPEAGGRISPSATRSPSATSGQGARMRPARAAPRRIRNSRPVRQRLRRLVRGSNVNTVNLGCPGETSSTLLNATNATTGCTTYPFAIHSNHPGKTQIQAAVDVLQSIGKRVSPITVNIGDNDILGAVAVTLAPRPPSSASAASRQLRRRVFASNQREPRLGTDTLRQEGGVKHEIIVRRASTTSCTRRSSSRRWFRRAASRRPPPPVRRRDQLATTLNSLQAATAAKYRAVFADPFPVFNPQGNPLAEINSICTKTAVCGPLRDIHPTDSGYADLAK